MVGDLATFAVGGALSLYKGDRGTDMLDVKQFWFSQPDRADPDGRAARRRRQVRDAGLAHLQSLTTLQGQGQRPLEHPLLPVI